MIFNVCWHSFSGYDFSCDYVSFGASLCAPRCPKMTFLLQKNSYFQGFTYIIKTMSFIIILSICCSILKSFVSYFRILFGYKFLHRFLIVFWSKNDAQNRPKMIPKSTPVRPRAASGFLASSGHLWTCHFYDF